MEKTKGRMLFLQQSSALSTIKIELIPDAVAKPVVQPGWQPLAIVKDAGRALVETLEWMASLVIWLVLYTLPVLLLFGLPIEDLRCGARAEQAVILQNNLKSLKTFNGQPVARPR